MREAGRSLGGNVVWTLSGYAASLACQAGILLTLARRGGPEQLGQFALGLAVAAPVVLFANLGLRRVQATDTGSRYRFADYFGLRLLTSAVAAGGVSVLAVTTGVGPDTGAVIAAMGVAKAVEAAADVACGLFQ
ncbi:MAG: lipopolysaccharide biosynthesis protein, partial [Actinomycetota bacterium]